MTHQHGLLKKNSVSFSIILFFCFSLISSTLFSQIISGVIKDENSGEPLFGASVIIKGTTTGTTTDFEGEFEFNAKTNPPFTLEISYIGYDKKEIAITAENIKKPVRLSLAASAVTVDVVEVKDTRITDKQKESPLTIESMGLKDIKQTPSADFYTGLGSLKGVDLTTASMGFVIVNTRGFNSTRPVRSLQLVDGADNQAPGLNFSLGNFAGASELDIQKVDLIVGASSALYGPAAFNGVLYMTTKNPFYHKGLTVMVKGAERRLFESGLRYARVIQNRMGVDKFAFKINFHYMRADDWVADNMAATPQSQVNEDNPGGYDAVNVYGDENQTDQTNNFNSPYGIRNWPGLGIFHRTGYKETDLLNYDMENIKASSALHYRVYKDIELIAAYNFGTGSTVYQGDNRYRLDGLKFHQLRVELQRPDKFYLRAYTTMENGGNTYDAVFTAFKLQEYVKSNGDWSNDYSTHWIRTYLDDVRRLPGFPPQSSYWFGATADSVMAQALSVLELYKDSLTKWHNDARAFADGVGNPNLGNYARLVPGTAAFDSVFNKIISTTYFEEDFGNFKKGDRGTKFYDKSKLVHVQGEYKFKPKFMDITAGASFRMYFPESAGTIFSDTGNVRITNKEYGVFASLEKKVWFNRFIFTVSGRMDKNENFNYLVSPAASIVYSQNDQTFRVSFSAGIRNPTLQDQYLFYNVGRAILIGNINGVDSLVTVESLNNYIATQKYDTLEFFNVPPVQPEKVKSLEVGYRGIISKSFYIDGSFYYSWYKDFLGYKIGVTPPNRDPNIASRVQAYRVSANSPDRVVTYGFSIALNYYFYKYYSLNGNYSWNVLDRKGSVDPIIPAFNTPEHKFNVGIAGNDMKFSIGKLKVKNVGFNFNYKWIQGFEFQGSPQFTGDIPSYGLLDGQINYTNKKIYTTFKLGASNLLNERIYQTYGGPFIGRMVYFSVTLNLDKI
jgi:iron complex outermembrane recepter protein